METNTRAKVLDHGYIQVIEHWGSDERIIEAARMSTAKGAIGWGPLCVDCNDSAKLMDPQPPEDTRCTICGCGGLMYYGDEKLLRFLYSNRHDTPFEMAGMIIEVKAPIMVFREWHRHRTQSYNEMSARYVPIPNEHYMPTLDRVMVHSTTNKQAGRASTNDLRATDALDWLSQLASVYEFTEQCYKRGLAIGIPKEIARLSMTVGRYSRMRASANLRNWLGFLSLRNHPAAQEEIRVYAEQVAVELTRLFPKTMALYEEKLR